MTHTPTPWAEPVYDNDDCSRSDWWEIEGVGRFSRLADAALARMAVNSHDKLVEALKAAGEVVKVAESMTACRGDDDWIWSVQEKIRAALEGLETP